MPSVRILVVEDNPTNAELMSFVLESSGYEVEVAANAQAALDAIESFHPRLIMMDVQMPGMDGLQLTRRLKSDPVTSAILIIVVTANAMKGDREKAFQAGCDEYMSKPIDTRRLPEQVAALLAKVPAPTPH